MSGDVVERASKGGKKGLRRPKRRIAISIDMTPMVDIAFLLLIFYMVTTVFSMPQAMEINLPKADEVEDVDIKESNLLTLHIDGESRYWWHLKRATLDNLPKLLPPDPAKPDSIDYRLDPDALYDFLLEQNDANPSLNTLILIHDDAIYEDWVNVLDEIDRVERGKNSLTAVRYDVHVDKLTSEQRFSYRYALGDWEDRDNNVIVSAIEAARASGELPMLETE